MSSTSTTETNITNDILHTLPITEIAYSIVSQLLEDGDIISLHKTCFPIAHGGNWETMCLIIKHTNDKITEVIFARDDSSDQFYSLECVETV